MPALYEVRADYDPETIVIYQAFRPHIALPALDAQRFVPPFSFNRMTWIKPSFLWLMERSKWGQKTGQHILAVRILRTGWEEALSLGVLTTPELSIYGNRDQWQKEFDKAVVHIQWDTERSISGAGLPYYSIQVGLSRQIIQRYVDDWIVKIEDYSSLAHKIVGLIKSGKRDKVKLYLPKEKVYPLDKSIVKRIVPSN
jgi:hypothetical protein